MVLARHTDFKSVVPVCKTGRRFDSPCPLHSAGFTSRRGEGRVLRETTSQP
jgi:hypothetical protein